MIETDLSKQQLLDVDPKAIQRINFTVNLDPAGNTTFFIIEEGKETVLDFSQGNVKVLLIYFSLITQYDNVNVKLSRSPFNELKSAIKNSTEVALLMILMMKMTVHISYYYIIHEFQSFVKLLQIILQLMKNDQKLNCVNRTIKRILG